MRITRVWTAPALLTCGAVLAASAAPQVSRAGAVQTRVIRIVMSP